MKTIPFVALAATALAACNPIGGVHLNSQVLEGNGRGVDVDALRQAQQQRAEAAAAERAKQREAEAALASRENDARTVLTSPGVQDAPTSGAPIVAPAPVTAAPVAPARPAQPASPARVVATAPEPVVPSAQSFSGQKTTVVGLGDPGRDGLWMETPLVSSRRNARLTAPNGKSVVVTLEPISGDAGQGSRLSIGGMRALGLPLTELVEIRVGPV
ncbi:hypothetical protein [Phaeobacter sp. HF9A]|uniref:hypothetical protein n=1 Tax=Phaeobacter sp. HF9A TaxID=2721561 RepID=UPI0020CA2FD8|nr:hypothetical protein [Phaeobacter sp. HF9A]